MNAKYFSILFTISIFLLISCARDWQEPESSIPAQDISITDLLTISDIYDSSGVIIIGKVWHLRTETIVDPADETDTDYTVFILADRSGTGIDVFAPSDTDLREGDFIKVVGIYRKIFQKEGDFFYNKIDAVRIESWNPGLGYWIKEYEFD